MRWRLTIPTRVQTSRSRTDPAIATDNPVPRSISLPVISRPHPLRFTRARIGRVRRRRTLALVFLHVLIAIHLLHWLAFGKTAGRFVLSDAMEALELGRLNPGFLLFAVAAIVTLVGGRWLCGWACHMGALQEACAWLLRKCGVRPRLLRVRVLGYVPIVLAAYMFIWPTLRRDILVPLLIRTWPDAASWLGPASRFPGFSVALTSNDLWRGMPSAWIAIPFLLVCGGATVFFLGARGFCRYGCPYGGIFKPLEHLAPARITVDLDSCDGCGQCTAACSSGIRVHEEVRAFGRVVSSDCVKTLDCVAACPRDALAFRFSAPSIIRGKPVHQAPAPRYDTTLGEELLVLAVFIFSFMVLRGLYDLVPMLMAVGLALCAAGIAWFAWRCVRRPDVRLAGVQLRRAGAVRPAGTLFMLLLLVSAVFLTHSATVRALHLRARVIDDRVLVRAEDMFTQPQPALPPATRADAEHALRLYRTGSSWRHGGIGLLDTSRVQVRIAWLELVLGNITAAEEALRRSFHVGAATDALSVDLARLHLMRRDLEGAEDAMRESLANNGSFIQTRDMLARLLASRGRIAEAEHLFQARVASHPDDAACRAAYGSFLLVQGNTEHAQSQLREALRIDSTIVRAYVDLAASLAMDGSSVQALAVLEAGASRVPAQAEHFDALARHIRGLTPGE
ncbi:MAG: tetratricopeptide repeat protein [Phycisphaeraceae bacterium]|nr:tetratricopeptide repeat protein [Phycisphaeraceae bacterium]MCW5762888.1 tetratricopeptide repeat protein [Phycisphaeraceae bacterium]